MLYDTLAKYYDELLGDNDALDLWVDVVKKNVVKPDVLELACGSGDLAIKLAKAGYNVLATDISQEMINVASNKVSQANPKFEIMDMTKFALNQKYDGILCFCDSFNYLNNYEEIAAMFHNVYQHLNSQGVFIFDTHHLNRLKEFKEEYIEEGQLSNVDYSWTILADDYNKTLMEHFAFYQNNEMIEENHLQHVFDYEKLKALLEAENFQVTYDTEFVKDEKVLFIGRKL